MWIVIGLGLFYLTAFALCRAAAVGDRQLGLKD